MAPGAYGQTSASLGGSFSHNAPINVCSLATVTVQFVQAIINSGDSGKASVRTAFVKKQINRLKSQE